MLRPNLASLLALGFLLTACSGSVETTPSPTSTSPGTGGAGGGPDGPESFVRLAEGIPWCAVRASGKVACWEQAGYDDFTVPGVVSAVPGIDDAIAATAGFYAVCVLRASGKVACWGSNEEGELGSLPLMVGTPTDLPGVEAIGVSSGIHVLCFIRPGGQVTCQGVSPDAGDVPGLVDAAQISGGMFGCAVRRNGQVACWPGLGMEAEPIAFITDATRVSASDDLGCALHATGEVSCWQLAVAGSTTKIKGFAHVRRLGVAGQQVCAADEAGDVACFHWGDAEASPVALHTAWDASASYSDPCVIHVDGALECGDVTGS
jgi:hypothetical protein